MSIFIPYSPSVVVEHFSTLFSINLTGLTSYETLMITIVSNIYFFLFWGCIVYFALKMFNRIWERLF